jgi:hypothetical protein
MRTALTILALSLAALAARAEDLTWSAAQPRLTSAMQQAKWRNDAAATAKIKDLAPRIKELIAKAKLPDARRLLEEAETSAGLDPGGRSMSGIAIFHPTPELADQLTRLRGDLDAAMRARDKSAINRVIEQTRAALGPQAGLPETASPGRRIDPRPFTPRQAVDTFIAAIEDNRAQFAPVASGRPLPDQMVRFYADIVAGCCEVRDLIKQHRPDKLDKFDALVAGACFVMTALQQPPGHMPFPDPRAGQGKWNVAVADDGGSQVDTGEAGTALLVAGRVYAKQEWLAAGLKAADWAAAQPPSRNFNYNSFSVRLLAEAFRATRNRKYLDAAIEKYELGLAPGQLDSGRWLDPHNARTVYHLAILRSTADLAATIPPQYDRPEVLEALRKTTALAVKNLLDEFDQIGQTNPAQTLPTLLRLRTLDPNCDARLPAAVAQSATMILNATLKDGQPKLTTPVLSLGTLARAASD